MKGLKHVLMLSLVFPCVITPVLSHRSREFKKLPLRPGEVGPESIAFDCEGEGPYVGISDGRILKWKGEHKGWIDFAVTSPNRPDVCNGMFDSPMKQSYCGRPMGLKFNKETCELNIADAYLGLMKVGSEGGVATLLANSAEGIPFYLTNGLDVDSDNGFVYFSDSSSRYHLWEFMQIILTGDRSGRLMKYDPRSQKVTVLLRNLSFPNGVALSKEKDFVLVAEFTLSRVLKFWLTGPKSGTSEVFVKLVGNPDNIKRNHQGDFWIASMNGISIKVNEYGQVLETLNNGEVLNPSEVNEYDDRLWIGYFDQPYVTYSKKGVSCMC